MRCDSARERFQKYIEGNRKGKDIAMLEKHLAGCPDCRHELENLQKLDARLWQEVPEQWQKIQPSPGFLARLKRMDLEPASHRTFSMAALASSLWGRHRTALVSGVSVCMVIIVAAAVLTLRPSSHENSEQISMVVKDSAEQSLKADKGTLLPETIPMPTSPGPQGERGPTGPSENLPAGGSIVLSPSLGAGGTAVTITGSSVSVDSSGVLNSTPMPRNPSDSAAFYGSVDLAYTAEEEELAKAIALEDSEVREIFGGQEPQIIGIYNNLTTDNFLCTGLAVVLEKNDASQRAFLYVCVDVENRLVARLLLSNVPPP